MNLRHVLGVSVSDNQTHAADRSQPFWSLHTRKPFAAGSGGSC